MSLTLPLVASACALGEVPSASIAPTTSASAPAAYTGTAVSRGATPAVAPTVLTTGNNLTVATQSARAAGSAQLVVSTFVGGLKTIWAMAFAADGRLFLTERGGRIRVVENGKLRETPVATLPVRETSEGGLLGLALDPEFPRRPYLYVVYTYGGTQGLRNRIARLSFDGSIGREDRVLLEDIPAGQIHNGGRIKVGPDGLLYVTTGETGYPAMSQDRDALGGKILRLSRDGSIPTGNPFPESAVYTLGHRNPQGLAFQFGTERLYQTEHGPLGNDEVNLVESGQNYGWPNAQGGNHPAPYRPALVTYSPSMAPGGATFYNGNLIPQWRGSFFFTALVGQHLHRLLFDQTDPRKIAVDERLYQGIYGRLRDVAEGPDGALYVATSNYDGRGSPRPEDDRVLRIAAQ